jgi:hypothetical protein
LSFRQTEIVNQKFRAVGVGEMFGSGVIEWL